MIRNSTKVFCEYLVKGGVAKKNLLTDKSAQEYIQNIIDNHDEMQKSKSLTIHTILSEHDEWEELYPQKVEV